MFIQLLLQLLLQLPLHESLQLAMGLDNTEFIGIADNTKIGSTFTTHLKKSRLLILSIVFLCQMGQGT